MLNKYTIGMVVIIATALSGYFYGVNVTDTKWTAKTEEAINEAVQAALSKERALQDEANKITQRQSDKLHAINNRLTSELDELRNRPSRSDMPRYSGTDCKGSSGPELSREDAEFLTREAARADRYAAALTACYEYADSLR